MSVVYGERGLSKMEFWRLIQKIDDSLTFIILHDFGVKNRTRDPNFYTGVYQMDSNDTDVFKSLCEKYGIQKITDEYPEWLIARYRTKVLDIVEDIKQNIRRANDVYPYYESEFYERRRYQNDAIRLCGCLYDMFTKIKHILPIDANKYMDVVGDIEKEKVLLKGWKKAENHILKRIRDKTASELSTTSK